MAKTIREASLLDIMPQTLKGDVSVQAYAKAFDKQIKKLLELIDTELIYPAIDKQVDWVLDTLAVEWQTQHYNQSYTTEEKRRLIKYTLIWYVHAGTRKAVEDLVNSVFGDGTVVVEYADSGDSTMKPYEFDIRIPNDVGSDAYEEFVEVIKNTKNARSHLRKVYKYDAGEGDIYIGIVGKNSSRTVTAGLERKV